MKTLAHVYPWDIVGDPAAPSRMRDLGVHAIALAAAYHSVRAATPMHPEHRLVDASHAALYTAIDAAAWRGRRLVPAPPAWMAAENSFDDAATALRGVGLPVYAWIVLTHASRLGRLAPDLTVRNAFGDRYAYALCPAQPEVMDYCATLVHEIVRGQRPDGVVLEACGPLGVVHGSHHEKTAGAEWNPVQQQLLSLCFCSACTARFHAADVDVESLRQCVRDAIATPPGSVEEALGTIAPAVARLRAGITRELRQRLVNVVRTLDASLPVVLHASADPWATGAFATVAGGVDADVDVLVVNGWDGAEASRPAIQALRDLVGPDKRLAAYTLALPPRPGTRDAFGAELAAFADAGVQECHLYHAGLASPGRLNALREALAGQGR